jgi:hypothetical protein
MNREATGPFAGMVVVRLEQPGKPVIVLDQELIQRMEATVQGCAGRDRHPRPRARLFERASLRRRSGPESHQRVG